MVLLPCPLPLRIRIFLSVSGVVFLRIPVVFLRNPAAYVQYFLALTCGYAVLQSCSAKVLVASYLLRVQSKSAP